MTPPRLSLLLSFLLFDGLGVCAVLLDDLLGGGWAADVLAVTIVLGGLALLLAETARYLRIAENPPPEAAAPEARRPERSAAGPRPPGAGRRRRGTARGTGRVVRRHA
jgi:hypothetical protein